MATTRERREARAERLKEWAEKREAKAEQLHARNEPFRGDIAFNTQPGRIIERERVNARSEKAWEHTQKAESMSQRAAGIESQLDRSIFSDDPDALERLTERIAQLEAKREAMKARNAEYRKAHRAELKGMTAYQRSQAVPHPGWEVSNLGADIRRNKERLVEVERRQAKDQATEEAGGLLVETFGEYVRVTFSEKPSRDTLDALKAAGFRWGQGSWTGRADALPPEVQAA